jgi:fibronectin-binding autotransporter adhesin
LNYTGKFDASFSADGSAASSLKSIHLDAPPAHAPSGAIVVPDAHFLFNADFKRSGVDLILSGDNRELVLHDYFKGEKRPALASPDGAHLTGDVVTALTGHVEISQAGTNPAAGQVIGHLTKLQGTATATRNGVSIILNNGDNVEKGDVVEAGSNSTVGITFIDGTVFGLSANARMVLNDMVYDPNGSNNSTLFNLVAGTISFVAGQTAKHGDMKIDTPVATMGIRGTAVLVQIDFSIPGQAGVPNASFQVLVEPDGTTGSYVLFDKTTLQPIATVNQAGQQININNGVISQSNAPLSPDVQKLIQDVFTQKFTDNSNTKQTSPFNDTLSPTQQGLFIKLADGSSAIANYVNVKVSADPGPQNTNGPSSSLQHIPGPPTVVVADIAGAVTTGFVAGELVGRTGDVTDLDIVQGVVRFADVNAGDLPTVKVSFSSFSYQSAGRADVTAGLSALQLADIAATAVDISVEAAAGNKNTGSATWTYSVADKAFDFLAAGEQLTLTYMVRVDNNYAPSNETKFVPITITVTGTNDAPVITTSSPTIAFSGGTSVTGGNLTTDNATSGTLSFEDADLTDTHTVAAPVLTDASLNGSELPLNERDLFANALTASIETDSTGTGNGVIDWKLADLPVYLADFIPKGETLVLTYTITVTDSQGATATQTITVNITGTDNPAVVWIATTAPGSASGGLWSVGANWETGKAPTPDDDAIIITDQLKGLTPSFPVTVDAPAAAKSLVMNDFRDTSDSTISTDSTESANSDSLQPTLINLSTLDIGVGGFSVSADAVVKNYGTITVAGATAFNATSELLNSGTFKLGSGGKFVDQSNIGNTGTGIIEIQGGTLDVSVDIANSGQIKVDSGAVLALDAGMIDGGVVTVQGTLQLDGESFVQNGSLANAGTVEVSGSGNVLSDEIVTNTGQIDIPGDLTSDLAQASNATSNLALKNGTEILGGLLTIGITGILEISTALGASLSGVDVDNSGLIEIDSGSLLALSRTTITGGALTDLGTVHVTGDSTIDDASLTGGALIIDQGKTLYLGATSFADANVTVSGTLSASGISSLEGATITNTGVLEVTGGTFTIDAASHIDNTGIVEANGGHLIIDTALSGKAEIAGMSTLELGADGKAAYSGLAIDFANDSSATLKLDHAESFTGEISNLDDDDAIDLADMALKGATVSFSGDATGGTLTITSSGEVSHIALEGNYLGSSWNLADDGSGHVQLTEVPGVLSGLDSHDNAVEAKAVTVSITDGGATVTDPTYTFETSINGTDWTIVQSGSSNSYTPTEADEGRQLKVVMSFTDHEGHHDTSSLSAGTVQDAPDVPPVILGETNPATQTIILSESPIVLPQGAFENSLGLHTETFDDTPAGSNGFSHGDFFSAELNAHFSASGSAGVVSGSFSASAAPFIGPSPGQQDATHYLSVGANGAETISFATEQNAFGLYWGSVDPSNKIQFYHGDTLVASYSGPDISPLLASGGQGSFASNGYVEFKDLAPFDKVVLSSATNSFELDNVSSGYVSDSHIHLAEPITGTMTVHDDDIGDQLTGLVTGPAEIKYNGSTTLPAGVNVNALINPSAITFESTTSDGKSDTLHWTYNPTGYNLDFLEPGDTLTITFNAQVSDGHAATGNQPLTITLTGTGSQVVNGTAQDDVFDHVGGGVSIFGHGGNDTFVFNANFGSATIGDFDLNHDTLKFDSGVFATAEAFFAAAQASPSGLDTVITDAHHDKLTLTGITVADLKAHPNDFHLV